MGEGDTERYNSNCADAFNVSSTILHFSKIS